MDPSRGYTTSNKTIQHRLVKEIRCFGILYHGLRPENILWNAVLQRALITDFYLCALAAQATRCSQTITVWAQGI